MKVFGVWWGGDMSREWAVWQPERVVSGFNGG